VCDLFIRGFDGFAALRIAQALTPTVPFVFNSGDMTEERSTTGLACGAYGCAQKDDENALIEPVKCALAACRNRSHSCSRARSKNATVCDGFEPQDRAGGVGAAEAAFRAT
jgi:hypothetical protein